MAGADGGDADAERFTGPDWVFERKLDGIRLLAFKQGPRSAVVTQSPAAERRLSRRRRCGRGPACARRDPRRRSDRRLARAGRGRLPRVRHPLARRARPTGLPLSSDAEHLLRALPLRRRWTRSPRWMTTKPWERACREGWEGVIAKRRDSPYEHRRSPHWLKMKCEATQELVVGGFTDPQGARVGLGALLVGYFEGDDFVLRRQGRHRLRHASCSSSCARGSTRSRSPQPPFTQGSRTAARARALGAPGDGRPGRVHRMDRRTASCATPRLLGVRDRQGAPRDVVRERAVITHPEKVLFPRRRITKGELAAYYEASRRCMLPHIRGRPITMERYPAASARRASCRRTSRRAFPTGSSGSRCRRRAATVHYPLVVRPAIAALARQSELHHAARLDLARARPRSPGLCVFDLDPSEEDLEVLRAATLARARPARELGLAELGEDIGLERLPRRGAARRQDRIPATSRAFAHAVARSWSSATRST